MNIHTIKIGDILTNHTTGTRHRVWGVDPIGVRGGQPVIHLDGISKLPGGSAVTQQDLKDYRKDNDG